MPSENIDDLASSLLEEAKRFLEIAKQSTDIAAIDAHLHAGLMLGFCALEAHVNAIADEFVRVRTDLSLLDKSILSDREIQLKNGEWKLSGLKMYRLEDRILFLH